jgi:hypothetical protein
MFGESDMQIYVYTHTHIYMYNIYRLKQVESWRTLVLLYTHREYNFVIWLDEQNVLIFLFLHDKIHFLKFL